MEIDELILYFEKTIKYFSKVVRGILHVWTKL